MATNAELAEQFASGVLDVVMEEVLKVPKPAVLGDPGMANAHCCALAWYADSRKRMTLVRAADAMRTPVPDAPIVSLVGDDGAGLVRYDEPVMGEIGFIMLSRWKVGRVFPYPEPWWSRIPGGASLTEGRGMLRVVTNFIRQPDGDIGLRYLAIAMEDNLHALYMAERDEGQRVFLHLVAQAMGHGFGV